MLERVLYVPWPLHFPIFKWTKATFAGMGFKKKFSIQLGKCNYLFFLVDFYCEVAYCISWEPEPE